MHCYRIVREKYSHDLVASGRANRWNHSNEFVIYAASSRSLAMLELLVHRSGIYPKSSYKILALDCDPEKSIEEISIDQLPADWQSLGGYAALQSLGSDWYRAGNSLMLKIPSAIVPKEHNFIINTQHGLFTEKIKIMEREDFSWDGRLL